MLAVDPKRIRMYQMKIAMAQSLNTQALALEKADKMRDAIILYEKAHRYCLEYYDNHADVAELMATITFHLANCHWQELHFKRGLFYCQFSLRMFRNLEDRQPDKFRPMIAHTIETLALIYMSLRDLVNEGECYRELLSIYHTLELKEDGSYAFRRAETLNRLAFNHCKQGLYNLSKAEYFELIEILCDTSNRHFENRDLLIAVAHEDLGRMYMHKGEYFLAKRYLDIAIRFLKPNAKTHYAEIARMYDCKAHCILKGNPIGGNMENAMALIEKAIKLDPTNADWYDTKGQILLRMNDKTGALQMWEKVIALEPFHLEIGGSELYEALFPEADKVKPAIRRY